MLDFIVMALPRSGTTWVSNLLTTDESFCLHDPFRFGDDEADWPRDARRFGIVCTACWLWPEWLKSQRCPIVVIERRPRDCNTSLRRVGLTNMPVEMLEAFDDAVDALRGRPNVQTISFDSMFTREGCTRMFQHLLPGVPFDGLRFAQLAETKIEPHQRVIESVKAAAGRDAHISIKE